MNEYTVLLAWDDEAQKWYAQNDDIPIILEDGSLDVLIYKVKLAAPEILELNNMPHTGVRLIFRMEAQALIA
jgi:hypothetical protein